MIRSKYRCSFLKVFGIRSRVKMVGPQSLSIRFFLQRLAQDGHFRAHRVREFHAHMTEAAESYDRDFLPGPYVPMPQRGVKRDTGAEQRRAGVERQIVGNAQNIILIDDDFVRIAAVSGRAIFFVPL